VLKTICSENVTSSRPHSSCSAPGRGCLLLDLMSSIFPTGLTNSFNINRR
jgi:hypothetical protein